MRVDDFDFDLPSDRIAQTPLANRIDSKLLVMDRINGQCTHTQFNSFHQFLQPGDLLVRNNTRVIPARLYARKTETGAKVEMLLLTELEPNVWEVLAKPARRLKEGMLLDFEVGEFFTAEVLEERPDGRRVIKFQYVGIWLEWIEKLGEMPLPPYITQKLDDRERYQTVFAKENGAVAAPTAGLHFTDEYIDSLCEMGIEFADVTLHVGLGTFRPVTAETIDAHEMHSEWYKLEQDAADAINRARREGRRIIPIGTTACRVLETVGKQLTVNDEITACSGWTDIFIYPGYDFTLIDALFTNFHLPKSTLLMLISALSSKENIMHAYQEAIEQNYRFFSFGDAMFIAGHTKK